MAREVNTLLGKIISKHRNVSETKGEEIVKAMRASNQYQEDVWS
jgi:NADPH-ferrihemoprotein reductase